MHCRCQGNQECQETKQMRKVKEEGLEYHYIHVDLHCHRCGQQVNSEDHEQENERQRQDAKAEFIRYTKKRREDFLTGRTHIQKFTKELAIRHYGVSEELFNRLLAKGYIQQNRVTECTECFRQVEATEHECKYCGHNETYLNDKYYSHTYTPALFCDEVKVQEKPE